MNGEKPISVTELNKQADRLLKGSALSDVCVQGELSRVTRQQISGHLYFTLKDSEAAISCAMWSRNAATLGFVPKDGMKVIVYGSCTIYEKNGNFQIVCSRIVQDGIGKLYEELARLKQKLYGEGYFDPAHKKQLPFLPRAIAVCTSPTGAVIEDIRKTVERRFPGMPVLLYPCQVQGKDVAPQIISAIKAAENDGKCDVIIVCRGGGSIEDLWCFNDEELAKAIYSCKLPVISAVGHGIDLSISDMVADVTAVTPTAAAELAVPEKEQLEKQLAELRIRAKNSIKHACEKRRFALGNIENLFLDSYKLRLSGEKNAINRMKMNVLRFNPRNQLTNARAKYSKAELRFKQVSQAMLERKKNSLVLLGEKLSVLGPDNVLSRGYSVILDKNGAAVTSESGVKSGDGFIVKMKDGTFGAKRD